MVKLLDYRSRWAELEAGHNPFATVVMAHLTAQATRQDTSGRAQTKLHLTRRQIRPRLHPDVAGMLTALQQDPAGFEQQMAGMITLEGLWSLVIGMSGERDRALYESAAFRAAYRRALEQGFAQGTEGYARDLVNALGAWPTAPEAIRIPVDLWYGLEDTSTVHSPDFGATLAARLPQVTHTTLAGEGGSILWTQSRAILERLVAHRRPRSDL